MITFYMAEYNEPSTDTGYCRKFFRTLGGAGGWVKQDACPDIEKVQLMLDGETGALIEWLNARFGISEHGE